MFAVLGFGSKVDIFDFCVLTGETGPASFHQIEGVGLLNSVLQIQYGRCMCTKKISIHVNEHTPIKNIDIN